MMSLAKAKAGNTGLARFKDSPAILQNAHA
jgi:hypothetical protein